MMYSSFYGHSWGSWGFVPWLTAGIGGLGIALILFLLAALIFLKGCALWHAARRGEKWWFVAILLINTLGILEIIYLLFIVKKWHKKVSPDSTVANS